MTSPTTEGPGPVTVAEARGTDFVAELERLRGECAEMGAWRDQCAAAASDLATVHLLLRGCVTALGSAFAAAPLALRDLSDLLETAEALTAQIGRQPQSVEPAHAADVDILTECVQVARAFELAFAVVIEVRHRPQAHPTPLLRADPLAFRRCLLDLIAYMLRVSGNREKLLLQIETSAPGLVQLDLSPADAPRGAAAAARRRADRAYPAPHPGSELADVKRFTLDQGGRFELPPGRCRLELPLEAAPETADDHQRRVLVVDDHRAVRRSVVRTLMRLGWETFEAADAESALELCATSRPELVITDVVMAGMMDGIDLAQELRVRHPSLAILLMSGHTPRHVPEDFEFVQKPIEEALLAEALERALARTMVRPSSEGIDDRPP